MRYLALSAAVFLTGCSGSLGKIDATDANERGLSYIAAAIVTHAVISLFRGR